MNKSTLALRTVVQIVCLIALALSTPILQAQGNVTGSINGTVLDQRGRALTNVAVSAISGSQPGHSAVTNGEGKFTISGLIPGEYTVQVSAIGFAIKEQRIIVTADAPANLSIPLSIASVSEEVKVEANSDTSIASELAPVKSVLDAGSARTEISSTYIQEFTSPVTDFADIIQAAPGTVSYTTNGIGNGQAKIFFRGFVDDDYTMTWDGVPFNDSNDPSHHSWAYIPAAGVGYVDFDRSPGTASDIGPSNFGGSIHFFSPKLGDTPHAHFQYTYGSWNTNQILGDISSGAILNHKAHFWINSDYQTSDGYQTFSPKNNIAATAKFDYQVSDRTDLTFVGSNIILDAFNNNDPTRRQLLHHGDNYLYDNTVNNSAYASTSKYYYDPQFYKYSVYHVPSFFYIGTLNHDYGKGWKLDSKTYGYGYSNHQHYQNATDQDLVTDSLLTQVVNEQVGGDDFASTSPYYSKKPTGVDKLNQYGRFGEIAALSYATKWGVFRVGTWYEYTNTLRYQIKTDPITWIDSPFISNIKFHEYFQTYATQPYAEFQLVSIPHWTITAGIKDAYYVMHLKQFADGKVIGPIGCPSGSTPQTCTNFTVHSQAYNSILPSFEANYRINNVWSVYGQYGRGSIAPFSAVFDTTGAEVGVTPPPTIATTYQGGTVVKLNRFAFDADAYHIHFTNTESTATDNNPSDPDYGFTYYYSNPDSNTNGFEAEGNYAITNHLSFNANGTFGIAKYVAAPASTVTFEGVTTPIPATPESWVALAPHDTESLGTTYHNHGIDFGIFGKRIGSRWNDIGNAHQSVPMDPFWMSNLFINYSIKGESLFAGSKIKLSINNIFDDHSVVLISAANDGTTLASPYTVNNNLIVSQDNQLYSPSWADGIEKQAGRAVMISFQFGITPRKH